MTNDKNYQKLPKITKISKNYNNYKNYKNTRYNVSWNTFIIAGHNFLTKLFRLISSLNSVEYEIGFRLEGFFFSVFFFIIHILPKLNRLHLRSCGRWSSLLYFFRFKKITFNPLIYERVKVSWNIIFPDQEQRFIFICITKFHLS